MDTHHLTSWNRKITFKDPESLAELHDDILIDKRIDLGNISYLVRLALLRHEI